jgi:hypothetical protein
MHCLLDLGKLLGCVEGGERCKISKHRITEQSSLDEAPSWMLGNKLIAGCVRCRFRSLQVVTKCLDTGFVSRSDQVIRDDDDDVSASVLLLPQLLLHNDSRCGFASGATSIPFALGVPSIRGYHGLPCGSAIHRFVRAATFCSFS